LQKALADAGVASRRHAEELIRAGRVAVNGTVNREMGIVVDPTRDRIQVDGRPVAQTVGLTYLMLNKPRRVVTTVIDPEGRPTVMHYLAKNGPRVYPVGRLDFDSEGLVLLTDDGALANRLMHPRYEHEKEYHVLIAGRPPEQVLEGLRAGVMLDESHTAPAVVQFIEHIEGNTWLRVILREGRKRQIRRMVEAMGYRVKQLIRVRIGTLRLGDLPSGKYRPLTPREVASLREA
jgi:23S rRNA pseudouridine2605 synthase